MVHNIQSWKDLIGFHPSSYIEQIIEDLNMSQEELAIRLGTTPTTISKLVNGENSVSNYVATKLFKLSE